MATYTYALESTKPHTSFGTVRHNVKFAVLKDGVQARQGIEASSVAAIEAAERTIDSLVDFAAGTHYTKDYGLTNEQGMGFSADSKKEWEQRVAETPLTRYVEDEFGEIVQETEIIEDNSGDEMSVNINAVSTDYTDEMPLGYVEIESIEALAEATGASVEKVSDTKYVLTCAWGNGEGEDRFEVEIL